ncbi:MAG: hypothetical protein GYB26_10025 [Gammaproteobacteria bacterium]|nr:hypothetical protein [Gammaproteobacteria bacterium]
MTKPQLLLFILASVVATVALASDRSRMQSEAENLSSNQQSMITGSITNNSDATEALPAGYDNPPQTQYNAGNMQDAAAAEAGNNEAAQTVSDGFSNRSAYVDENDDHSYLDHARNAQANPRSIVDTLQGEYSDCEVEEGSPISDSSMRTCDLFYETSSRSCDVERVLEVDADHKYECSKTRNSQTYNCTESLALRCPGLKPECDEGGIRPGSVESDMKWVYRYPTLTVGTIANNYWGGSCAVYDRLTTFTVEDVDKIKEFRLVQVGFDDYINIRLNGQLIYNGPYGGNKLDVVTVSNWWWSYQYVDIGNERSNSCELSTSWNKQVNIDLRPFLVNGTNSLSMRVVVAGAGEGWMKIIARQKCDCPRWEETWTESCR